MKDDLSTLSAPELPGAGAVKELGAEALGLVLAWSAMQPGRAGEVAFLPTDGSTRILGRGSGDGEPRMHFIQQRPGTMTQALPLEGPGLSRRQLQFSGDANRAEVVRIGKCALLVNGQRVERTTFAAGDTLHLLNQALFVCVRRRRILPARRDFPLSAVGAFGQPDQGGIVGESELTWALRERLAFIAQSDAHVLILGASGTGKELAAQAIHTLSGRARRPLIARNAATFPEELIDAELFGNVRDYPNPGMRERQGLIGEADGGTLFLDEIGELAPLLQSHLLRVLDQGGEYQRLGDAVPRRANLRVIAATNRDPEYLKHDLLGRFNLRLSLPPLDARREDIPLLVDFLVRRTHDKSPQLVQRFLGPAVDGRSVVRLNPALLEALLRHHYSLHLRELHTLIWVALQSSPGSYLELTPEVHAQLATVALPPVEPPLHASALPESPAPTARPRPASGRVELSRDEILAALQRHGGNLSQAYQELGLTSRYALYRVLKKHGLPLR